MQVITAYISESDPRRSRLASASEEAVVILDVLYDKETEIFS